VTALVSSCGAVALSSECLSFLSDGHDPRLRAEAELSINSYLLPKVAQVGGLYVFNNADGFFLDIGTPENYHFFQQMAPLTLHEGGAVA
jgi:NDP-sugar pyrophosphorylase family protein